MHPVYGYMDSYPHPSTGNHFPYPHYSFRNLAFVPGLDQDKPPITFEPWSYSHSSNYPRSTECHGCCKYSYPPGYDSFRPPQAHHLPPAPPAYFHGPYPAYGNAYPPCFVPPSYYPSEQARHGYDRGMSKDLCCGCPNHPFNSRRDGNVKIEEEKTEDEQKHDVRSSLVKQQNYPYPIVWIPPGYVKDKETSNSLEVDRAKDKETSKPFELDPKVWNGWLPFDLNSLRSLKHAGEDNRNQIQRDDKGNNDQMNEAKKTSPYPIIWLPDLENQGEVEKKDLKDVNASPKVAEEVQPKFKIVPVKFIENENRGERPDVAEEASDNGFQSVAEDKETTSGSTPVKQLEIKERDAKPCGSSGKQLEASKENKSSDESPSSPVKASKLPPVCLRVDPLPKKKNGNGTSRSPSPPVARRSQQDSKQQDSIQDKKKADNKKEEQPKKKEIKVVEVQDKSRNQTEQECKAVDVAPKGLSHHEKENTGKLDQAQVLGEGPAVCAADISTDRVADELKTDQRQHGKEELEEVAANAVRSEMEEQKKLKRELSRADAAVLIQSAYRGFEVRKWEPLKKLKQIARVHEQANDVRGKICALENSARLQQDEKQKIVINETIMSLLLQLDTIQGLHPSVREIRKSVARELVGLQAKLDQLTAQPAAVDKPTVGEDSAQRGGSKGLDESTHDQKVRTQQQEQQVKPPTMSFMASDQKLPEPQLVSEVAFDPKRENVIELHLVDEEQQKIKPSEIVEGNDAEVEAKELVSPLPSVVNEMSRSGCQELVQMLPVKEQSSDTEIDVSDADSSIGKLIQPPIAEQQIVGSAMDGLVEDSLPKKSESPSKDFMELPRTMTESESRIAEASEKLIGNLPSAQVEGSVFESKELQMEGSESGIAEASEKEITVLPSVRDEEVTSESPELQMATRESGIAETSGKVSGEQPSVEDEESTPGLDLSSPQDGEAAANLVKLPREQEHKVVEESEYGIVEPTVEKPNEPTLEKDEPSEYELEKLPVLPSPETGFCAVDSTCGIESNQSSESMIPDVARENDLIKGEGGESIKTILESVKELSSPENGNPGYAPAEMKSGEDVPTDRPTGKEETKPGSGMLLEATDFLTDEVSSATVEGREANEVWSPVPVTDSSADIKLRKEKDLVEENENLKMMLEKLIEAGKQQLTAMSDLNGRVRDLERKLSEKKKKSKMNRRRSLGPTKGVKAITNPIMERHTTSAA